MLKKYLNQLMNRQDLTVAEASELFRLLTGGEAGCVQSSAVLSALRTKGECVAELTGGARALRASAHLIHCGAREVVDIVGTGGDGGASFNISTTSSFVAAGAGVAIAKHGNRAVSGKCGAADVLAELGFDLEVSPEVMEHSIQEHGIGFLFAPKLHPAMACVAVLRRELGVRTIFNLLGPLCNPAGARRIVLGVYAPELTELMAEALRDLGARHALVVHGNDGLDEITCCTSTRVTELKDGMIRSSELLPELLLGRSFSPEEIAGGDAKQNAGMLLAILEGRDQGGGRAAVLLNAGATCYVAGVAETLRDGITLAKRSIDSGAAREKLEQLIRASQS